jgi:putative oxidoreductase
MQQILFSTDTSLAGLILRLTIGLIMFPHGAQKMFGLFGGYGFKTTMKYFTETVQLPWFIGLLVILIEFVGAVGLILGFGSKIWAALLIILMLGAIITTNYSNGFFMNWFGNQKGEGFEYHLLVIGLCFALIVTGSGKLALDNIVRTLVN